MEPENYDKDGISGVYGREYTTEELIRILLKDQDFWDTDGGVTFSGGEALLQTEALLDILKELKERKIHTAVETALFVSEESLRQVLPYIDYWIVDVKILNSSACKEVLGGKMECYRKNVNLLYSTGRLKLFRMPCCREYTFTEENKRLAKGFFQRYWDIPVQIFAIHSLGEKKYQSLGRPMWKAAELKKENLEDYCQELKQDGIMAEVIRI